MRKILENVSQWEVCGETIDGRTALEKVGQLRPDVIVMDAPLPGDIEPTHRIRELPPASKVVLVSAHDMTGATPFYGIPRANNCIARMPSCRWNRNGMGRNELEARP